MYTSVFKNYSDIPEEDVDRIVSDTAEKIDSETIRSLDIFKGITSETNLEEIKQKIKNVLIEWDENLLCKYEDDLLIQIIPCKDKILRDEFGEERKYYFMSYILSSTNSSGSRSWFYDLDMLRNRKEYMMSKGYSGLLTGLVENTNTGNKLDWLNSLCPDIYSSVEFLSQKKSESDNLVRFYRLTY